ncbi:hypothetical protein M758_3G087300 [Ceratodon purpureus]|uniref:Uncharacterized protein n=1 Tax=Ceratodon purpureus TaxID=3225 RepID=A0A8T0IIR2_CERPU|nr:hypothetical protein KC19_3G086100 [Ceratodon purpureus]KAG0622292.1 hypothetical protein M758_3G087300 [Ceratodon purpureus]
MTFWSKCRLHSCSLPNGFLTVYEALFFHNEIVLFQEKQVLGSTLWTWVTLVS